MRRILFVLSLLLACGFIAYRISQHNAFESDMLKLLPPERRDAVLENAVARVRAAVLSHTLVLVGDRDAARARAAADAYVQALQQSGVFEHLRYQVPEPDPARLADFYRPYGAQLLSATDRDALQRGDSEWAQQQLATQLFSPMSFGGDEDGHLQRFLQDGFGARAALRWHEGVLSVQDAERLWLLIDAQGPPAVFDDAYQQKAKSAFDSAQAALQTVSAEARVLRTGPLPYAIAARTQTEREINLVGGIDTFAVLLLLFFCLRRFQPLWLMGSVIVAALVFATALSLLIFERVHLMTFVFGTTLIGIAGDYALHALVLHGAAGVQWKASEAMQALRKPLTAALMTTLLAYAAITLTPFDGFRQMAVFCMLGLLAAFITVVFVFPESLQQAVHKPVRGLGVFTRIVAYLQKRRWTSSQAYLVLLLCFLIAIPGWQRLRSDDDIHQLQAPDATLLQQQQDIAQVLQRDQASQFYLIRASDTETLLQREERLLQRLEYWRARGAIKGWRALSQALPSLQRQQYNEELWQQAWHGGVYQQAWLALGLADGDRPAAGAATASLLPEAFLAQPYAQALQLQWLGKIGDEYCSIVLLDGVSQRHWLAQDASIEGVQFVDETASLSKLFGEFRHRATFMVVLAYLIVLLLLWHRVGRNAALLRLAPTVMATGLTLALLGYMQQPINLFHGVALMLVLGIGVDYAMFLADGEGHEPASLLAIVLSAITALLVFGALGFSQMPAVAGFGMTVAIGVLLALLLAPMVLLWRKN